MLASSQTSVRQGHLQKSAWSDPTNDWLSLVVGKLSKQYPDLKSFRLVCQQWRMLGSDAIVDVQGQNIGDHNASLQTVTNMFSRLPNLCRVFNIPCKYLPCLTATPSQTLRALSLTGTGSATLFESSLPQMTSLQTLTFRGPITMTDTLLYSLSHLPQLQCLNFRRVLFPRIPFEQSCFHVAYFTCLDTLSILSLNPLDSNGEKSSATGQQFVLSLPHLQRVFFGMGATNQLVQHTLKRVTKLEVIDAAVPKSLEFAFATGEAGEWEEWSKQRGV